MTPGTTDLSTNLVQYIGNSHEASTFYQCLGFQVGGFLVALWVASQRVHGQLFRLFQNASGGYGILLKI